MSEPATTATPPARCPAAPPPDLPTGATEGARQARIDWLGERLARLRHQLERALVGKPDAVRLTLACLVAGGHLLIDDVPGVGKTSLARALAAATAGTVHRLQGTTDVLPSDVTGTQVWNPVGRAFEFRPGPVFANVVVVDEINRMPPRSQSALLEVMEERQVSVDGVPRPVPSPFLVVATQNPVDPDSTFDLPEAQLDRFLMRLTIGYPEADDEVDVALRQAAGVPPAPAGPLAGPVSGSLSGPVAGSLAGSLAEPVVDPATVDAMVAVRREVHVSRVVARYCVDLCRATRQSPAVQLGAGPRASGALVTAAQAWAGLEGRAYATPDDVKAVALPVLAHRLMIRPGAGPGVAADAVVDQVLATVAVPRERVGA